MGQGSSQERWAQVDGGTGAGDRPAISVVVVTWNCRELALDCLRSIFGGGNSCAFEVIVVDNASADGTTEAVASEFPQAKVVRNPENRGFAAACNQGIELSRGELVFLLNPDCVLPERALDELVEWAGRLPEAGVIGPKLLNPDGTLQPSCRRFPRPMAALFRSTILGRIFARNRWTDEYLMADFDHARPAEVDWVSGAAMLIRRQALEQVGLLDEGFFWGSEDVDLCKRMWDAGWKVYYVPSPAIVHLIGGSTDRAVLRTIFRRHASWSRLFRKHFARNFLHWAFMAALIWLRAGLLAASWAARVAVFGVVHTVQKLFKSRAGESKSSGQT